MTCYEPTMPTPPPEAHCAVVLRSGARYLGHTLTDPWDLGIIRIAETNRVVAIREQDVVVVEIIVPPDAALDSCPTCFRLMYPPADAAAAAASA